MRGKAEKTPDAHPGLNINQHKLAVVLKAVVVGALTGAIVSLYRLTLTYVEAGTSSLYALLRANLLLLPLFIVALAVLAVVVKLLLNWSPMATGSGIPQVHGLLTGRLDYPWLPSLIVKFVAGVLCLFGGLSMGRAAPCVQMGASVATGTAKHFSKSHTERNILIAAGGAAGLSAAFGAPLAAVIFAFEELLRYLSPITLVATIAASVVADFVAVTIFGLSPVFNFPTIQSLPLQDYWIMLVLGIVCGLAGASFNISLLWGQKVYKKLFARLRFFNLVPVFLATLVPAILLPQVVGSGHDLLSSVAPETALLMLIILVFFKHLWTAVSFSSGTPGGIFFPLLVLGALFGAICGNLACRLPGVSPDLFYNFVILGMVAMFSAIVRAPITGIVLLTEMTGTVTHLLPLTIIALISYFVADALRVEPIYDSLLETMVVGAKQKLVAHPHARTTMSLVVHQGSQVIGKTVAELQLPDGVLLISVRRAQTEHLPRPDTVITAGDFLSFLLERTDEEAKRNALKTLFAAA
jgi:H+/Cl- antiporter ClcA